MSTIQTELYDALQEAGVTEPKARAAAEAMAAYSRPDELATKADLARLEGEVKEMRGEINGKILLLHWMFGFILVFLVAILFK